MRIIQILLLIAACIPTSAMADNESYKAKVYQLLKDANTQEQMMSMVTIMAKEFAPLIEKQMNQAVDRTVLVKKLDKQQEQQMREYTKKFVAGYFPYLQKAMLSNMDKLYEANTIIYQKHFTEQELDQIIKLTREPVMRKFTSIAPTMMQESASAVQPMISAIVGQATKEYMFQAPQQFTGGK